MRRALHHRLSSFFTLRLRVLRVQVLLIRLNRIINCRRLWRTDCTRSIRHARTSVHRPVEPSASRVAGASCVSWLHPKLAPSLAGESVGGDDADVFQTCLNLSQTRLQVGNDRKHGIALVLGDESVAVGVGQILDGIIRSAGSGVGDGGQLGGQGGALNDRRDAVKPTLSVVAMPMLVPSGPLWPTEYGACVDCRAVFAMMCYLSIRC